MSTKWCPELLQAAGGNPWRALILAQLCYWTTRTKDPTGWIHKTAEELRAELGVSADVLTTRSMRRHLEKLEKLGALKSDEGWQRRKSYRVNEGIRAIAEAVESSRGPSSIVHSDENVRRNGRKRPNGTDENVRMGRTETSDGRTKTSDGRTKTSDARTEITAETTAEIACRHAGQVSELSSVFTRVGKRLAEPERDLAAVVEAVVEHDAPWDYVVLVVPDMVRRMPQARPATIATKLVEDLAEAKWLTDPLWAERLRALEAERRRKQNIAENEAFRTDEDVLDEAGPALVEVWRAHIRRRLANELGASQVDAYLAQCAPLDTLVADELRDGLREPPEDEA